MLNTHSQFNPLFYVCFDYLDDLFIFIAWQKFASRPKSARSSHRNGFSFDAFSNVNCMIRKNHQDLCDTQ